jgi:hypothetical protein
MIAFGRGSVLPSSSRNRRAGLSSIASIGDPWDMKSVGNLVIMVLRKNR